MWGTRSFHLLEDHSLPSFLSAAGTSGTQCAVLGDAKANSSYQAFFFTLGPTSFAFYTTIWSPQTANLWGMEIKECHVLLICESHLPCLELGICALRNVFLKCRCVSKMKKWNKSELCVLKTVTLIRCSCLREDLGQWCFLCWKGHEIPAIKKVLLGREKEQVDVLFLPQWGWSNYVWSKRVLSFSIRQHMDSTLNWSEFKKADAFTTFLERLARIKVGGSCCGRWHIAELTEQDAGTFMCQWRQAITSFIALKSGVMDEGSTPFAVS